MALLTKDEKRRIEAAVKGAEAKTAGEIVVAVTPSSAAYAGIRLTAAGMVAVALGMLTFRHAFEIPGWMIFLAQLPTALLFYMLLGWGPLLRQLVPEGVRAAVVDTRAKAYFLDGGVLETRDRSGVLIFLSELEHRVEIIADRGIHERVEADEWQRDVDSIIRKIREHKPCEGLIHAVERIGDLLGKHFPPRPDDTNELADAVREIR